MGERIFPLSHSGKYVMSVSLPAPPKWTDDPTVFASEESDE